MKRIIYFMFALLGFGAALTSCSPDMYGPAYADYHQMERVDDSVEEVVDEDVDNTVNEE